MVSLLYIDQIIRLYSLQVWPYGAPVLPISKTCCKQMALWGHYICY